MSEPQITVLPGVQDFASGTAKVAVTDPDGKVVSIGFEVATSHPSGWVKASGPYAADNAPAVLSTSLYVYEKEVLLDPDAQTEVRAVVTLRDGTRRTSEATVFAPRGQGLVLRLLEFREVARTATEVTFAWTLGSGVDEVWVYDRLLEQPVPGDPWPSKDADPQTILGPGTDRYTALVPTAGWTRYLQFEPRARWTLAPGPVQRAVVSPVGAGPWIEHVEQQRGATSLMTDLSIRFGDPRGLGGTVRVWVNPAGVDSADHTQPPDGSYSIPGTPATLDPGTAFTLPGGGTATLLAGIRVHPARGKRVYVEFVNSEGESTKVRDYMLHGWGGLIRDDDTLREAAIQSAAQFAAGIRPVEVYDALPASATIGQVALLTSNQKLYRWNGTEWTAHVESADVAGKLLAEQIANGAIRNEHIAARQITGEQIVAGTITGVEIVAGSVNADRLLANSITAGQLAVGAVTAAAINVQNLSSIKADVGVITAGRLRNWTDTVGWVLGGPNGQVVSPVSATGMEWSTYLNFSNPSYPLLKHSSLQLNWDGTAVFSGILKLRTDSTVNRIDFEYSGVTAGQLVLLRENSTTLFRIHVGTGPEPSLTDFYSTGTSFTHKVFVMGDLETGGHLVVGASGWTQWRVRNVGDLEVHEGGPGEGSLQFVVKRIGGGVYAKSYNCLSPVPPKAAEAMTADGWLEWGVADARKPVWSHPGLPTEDHPAVVEQARRTKRERREVASEELARHEKDLGKIAIGTARWADVFWTALREARDFDHLKQLLEI